VVANGASMQMVEGSIPTVPRSSYNGSCSDHGLEGNLVKLLCSSVKYSEIMKMLLLGSEIPLVIIVKVHSNA
jgi:hypothetical protein